MISAVEVCVDFGRGCVFHVCFDMCVVYGVDICVHVGGVVCIVCFLSLGVACCVVM